VAIPKALPTYRSNAISTQEGITKSFGKLIRNAGRSAKRRSGASGTRPAQAGGVPMANAIKRQPSGLGRNPWSLPAMMMQSPALTGCDPSPSIIWPPPSKMKTRSMAFRQCSAVAAVCSSGAVLLCACSTMYHETRPGPRRPSVNVPSPGGHGGGGHSVVVKRDAIADPGRPSIAVEETSRTSERHERPSPSTPTSRTRMVT
jgi:hypothetical protein